MEIFDSFLFLELSWDSNAVALPCIFGIPKKMSC